jgi:hypothetical protein
MLRILIIYFLMVPQQPPSTFTGIEYINGTDSLKVTLLMNYELFLRDYQQTIFDDLDIEFLRSLKPFPADLANNYLNSKLRILVKNREVVGKLQKMEKNDGNVKFSILYRVDRKLQNITVRNTILNGLSSKVENMVIVKDRYTESAKKFTPVYTEETFILKKKSSGLP